jgi:GNAT superfamily N-acetyltransferase
LPVEVRGLDLADESVAQAVLALQRAAYAVEAELIGSSAIPALTESITRLRAARETWLGAFDPIGLTGAIAWRELDRGAVDICRLMVAPRAFRQGVATALLDALDASYPVHSMVVSTGSGNAPAIALYRARGFRPVGEREAAPGLLVTALERP